MRVNSDEKIRPVDPARFHQALGVYQAALAAAENLVKPFIPGSRTPAKPEHAGQRARYQPDNPTGSEIEQ